MEKNFRIMGKSHSCILACTVVLIQMNLLSQRWTKCHSGGGVEQILLSKLEIDYVTQLIESYPSLVSRSSHKKFFADLSSHPPKQGEKQQTLEIKVVRRDVHNFMHNMHGNLKLKLKIVLRKQLIASQVVSSTKNSKF